jgi:hypothetical protein
MPSRLDNQDSCSGLHSLRPRWTAILSILRDVLLSHMNLSIVDSCCSCGAMLESFLFFETKAIQCQHEQDLRSSRP